MRPRCCSNPACQKPIVACMGSVKAGDVIEAEDGLRSWTEVRELCGICALWMTIYCPTTACSLQRMLLVVVGWEPPRQKLLPAPA